MGARSFVSLFLILIPIGATLGLLFGLDRMRVEQGETPLFQDNSVTVNRYCQKSYGISPASVGQQYTLNPNQWGWTPSMGGGLCMNVTFFNNDTYATPSTAPQWSVTWDYSPKSEDNPVHGFPNIALDPDGTFPVLIRRLSNLLVETRWTYSVGHKSGHSINMDALTTAGLNANVAIDMFLDSDFTNSQSTVKSRYEVMVWLGRFGPATEPIGFNKPVADQRTINGTTFALYHGKNNQKQHVLTWVVAETGDQVPNFVGDISPLLKNLEQFNGPKPSDYLGYMGMGSETYFSSESVTFDVHYLSMNVK